MTSSTNAVVFIKGWASFDSDWPYLTEFTSRGLNPLAVPLAGFASNYDRACELFARLKGTRVDYGACHSRDSGHERFGEDFTGAGLLETWNEENKAHFVGHSLGAGTLLTLERLLHDGSNCAEDTSELFTGGNKDWIKSVTTMSAAYNGTPLLNLLGIDFTDFVRDLIVVFAGLLDQSPLEDTFPIDLSQWGLEEEPGENFFQFWARVKDSGLFDEGNEDFSVYDLTEAGSFENNNERPQTYPGVYYFSIATERTHEKVDCFLGLFFCGDPYETPDDDMSWYLKFSASILGKDGDDPTKFKNDGVIPFINQICPVSSTYGRDSCVEYDGTWNPGVWTWMSAKFDHLQVNSEDLEADMENYETGPKKLFVDLAQRLASLPEGNTASRPVFNVASVQDATFESVKYLGQVMEPEKPSMAGPVALFVFVGLAVIALVGLATRQVYNKGKRAGKEEKIEDGRNDSVEHYLSSDSRAAVEVVDVEQKGAAEL